MKPSNTIVVSPKYIEEKERQIADLSKKVKELEEEVKREVASNEELLKIQKRLEERLADADKTIAFYDNKDFHYTLADGTVMGAEPAHKYKIKWDVK